MKKITLGTFGILIVLMLLPMFTMPAVYAADESDTPPAGYTPTAATEYTDPLCDKLIIRDVNSWAWHNRPPPDNKDWDVQAVIDAGGGTWTYNIVFSATVAAAGFKLVDDVGKPIWRAIIIESDQDETYYDNLLSVKAKFADYVSKGGVLLAHMCDGGWNGGTWDAAFLPGGVSRILQTTQSLTIVLPGDPLMAGVTDAGIDGWGRSTHGYFTNLVAGTKKIIVFGTPAAPDMNKPVYIEYQWGKGLVKATMQTLEWSAMCRSWTGSKEGYTIMLNELPQAQAWFPEMAIPTVVVTSVLFAAMAIFLRKKRRLLIKP